MSLPRCRRCHRVLKDPESISIGFGKTCFEKTTGKAAHKSMRKPRSGVIVNGATKRKYKDNNMSIFDLISENQIEEVRNDEEMAKENRLD